LAFSFLLALWYAAFAPTIDAASLKLAEVVEKAKKK
jgi:hypothetical protein